MSPKKPTTSSDDAQVNERTSLLKTPSSDSKSTPEQQAWASGEWKKCLVLLVGIFIVNFDSAALLALFRRIGSEFDQMSSASWIVTAYVVGVIATQPIYGKLSDIYGRKPLLLFGYACYCAGGLIAGTSTSFWGILVGRAICGVGNAGMSVLISILIVDFVPREDVAVWRGYVYAINFIGRAFGPTVGGFLADNVNWRWCLVYHIPINTAAAIFIWRRMNFPLPSAVASTTKSKFKRIDFAGSISLAIANVSFLLFLHRAQKHPELNGNAAAVIPLSTWLSFIALFMLVEAFWAKEPIFPLQLLTRPNVISAYAMQFLLAGRHLALYTSIPLYFQVVMGDSTVVSATRLLTLTIGTLCGGLVSGAVIKRTKLHRRVILSTLIPSNLCLLAIFIRWRGPIHWSETLYCFPAGLAYGVSLSAAFVALTTSLEASQVAVGTSGFYLSLNLGILTGVSLASMLITSFVEHALKKSLSHLPNKHDIIRDVTSNLDNIYELPEGVAEIVRAVYMKSFVNVWMMCLLFEVMALMAAFVMQEAQVDSDTSKQKQPERSPSTAVDEEDGRGRRP
ncbi:putative multidrug resistance protein fnx1 [Cladorrhinum sp. PSN332]|nr:putative multidrug resistance protein fnx1 [Cladorrhinum sp. PSN332]